MSRIDKDAVYNSDESYWEGDNYCATGKNKCFIKKYAWSSITMV